MPELNKQTVIKIIELVLAIVIYVLHYYTFYEPKTIRLVVVSTGFTGYLFVAIGLFLGLMLDEPVQKKCSYYFIIVGAILYIVGGALAVESFQSSGRYFKTEDNDIGTAKGALGVILGIVYIVDGVLIYKENK